MIASKFSKTLLESQLARRYCQMFSTGFSSGAREGRKIGGDVFWHIEFAGGVPSGAVEQQHGMCAFGDVARDFVEVELHRFGVGIGQRERGANAPSRADRAKQVGVVVTLIGGLSGPGSASGPLTAKPFFWPILTSS